jgi:hypothetical protein
MLKHPGDVTALELLLEAIRAAIAASPDVSDVTLCR